MNHELKSVELFLALGLVTFIGVSSNPQVNAEEINELPVHTHLLSQDGEGGIELSPGEQANANFQDKLSGAKLLSALRQGGHVIYFRHAQTEKDYADQVTADVNNCATQRVLSEIGWQQARTIGAAFEDKSIPVGKVISSQYCRAWKTADLAFGKYDKNPALNFLPFEDYTEEQVAQMKAKVMPLLTAVPETRSNTVIVGHDDIFESATGIYPDPQGIAYVLKPDGNGNFEIIANMLPEEWSHLGSK
ncbi:MAG: histidine phosphatase family protein [Symploca sp. SIO3C6]|nr:histidine phosphatase family protein [Symploca sp. SIO3C6]